MALTSTRRNCPLPSLVLVGRRARVVTAQFVLVDRRTLKPRPPSPRTRRARGSSAREGPRLSTATRRPRLLRREHVKLDLPRHTQPFDHADRIHRQPLQPLRTLEDPVEPRRQPVLHRWRAAQRGPPPLDLPRRDVRERAGATRDSPTPQNVQRPGGEPSLRRVPPEGIEPSTFGLRVRAHARRGRACGDIVSTERPFLGG